MSEMTGTLMWIGDRSSPEFCDAYQFADSQVAQLAKRHDLDDAIRRPAAAVRRILITQATRHPIDGNRLERLSSIYPRASFMLLQGTLCEGMQKSDIHDLFDSNTYYWHRWNQIIPQWLVPCGASDERTSQSCNSVAIVASSFSTGEALMDLAESARATTVWCPGGDTHRVRNVDAVWWDDSVAAPTSSRAWRKRIAVFDSGDRAVQHAWIVNSPRIDQHRQATGGGIDLIVSKPYRVDCLLSMFRARQTRDEPQTVSRAA